VNAAAQESAIGFKKNEVARLREGANQVRDSRMKERLWAAYPDDRRVGGGKATDFFKRNGLGGILVQNFRRVKELDRMGAASEPRANQFGCEAQRKAQHAD
jgi:hypothetical protein